jgi:hypothetical protein
MVQLEAGRDNADGFELERSLRRLNDRVNIYYDNHNNNGYHNDYYDYYFIFIF